MSFALYLRGCCNVMSRLNYINELNVTSILKGIVMKLAYKLRDKWQTKVEEKLKESNSVFSFTELVQFIEKQAKICSNLISGDIQESVASRNKRLNASKSLSRPKPFYAINMITLRASMAQHKQ